MSFSDGLRSDRGVGWLRRGIVAVLVLGLSSCAARGANQPADPYLLSPGAPSTSGAASAGGRTLLPGFEETMISVRSPLGQLLRWCVLLARTTQQQERGLMQVTDAALGGYDGMLFRFPSDTMVPFWMRNTPMPLSIAYLDSKGALVSAADMAPCADSPSCPGYPPKGPFRLAIEVPQGGLARLGVEPGAVVIDEQRACT